MGIVWQDKWAVAVGQAANRPDWTTSHLSLEIQRRAPCRDEEGLWHSRRDPGVWILTLLQRCVLWYHPKYRTLCISAWFMWKMWDNGCSPFSPSSPWSVTPGSLHQCFFLSLLEHTKMALSAVSCCFNSSNNGPCKEASTIIYKEQKTKQCFWICWLVGGQMQINWNLLDKTGSKVLKNVFLWR